MLVIQPTADGRLRIFNNHRSDYARDESSARTLAYNWGHTDISINKALSEMRSASRGEAQPAGWRVTRAGPAPEEPAPRVEMTAPVAERRPRARKVAAPPVAPAPAAKPAPNTVLAPAKPAAPAPKAPAKARAKAAPVAAPPPAKAAVKATVKAMAKTPAKAVAAKAPPKAPAKAAAKTAVKATVKEPVPKPAPRQAPAPREKALSLFRSGVKELAGMEDATLAFARGPWSELREMAEYITACLEGKRPKTGWERK